MLRTVCAAVSLLVLLLDTRLLLRVESSRSVGRKAKLSETQADRAAGVDAHLQSKALCFTNGGVAHYNGMLIRRCQPVRDESVCSQSLFTNDGMASVRCSED